MRRSALCVVTIMVLSASVLGQERGRGAPPPQPRFEPGASQADVDQALVSAGGGQRNGATVIRWKPADWTYDTLRKGTNRMVCYDKSGLPGQQSFSIECTSIANLDYVAQNLRFESDPDKTKRQAAIDAAEKNGTRARPEFGSITYLREAPNEWLLLCSIQVPGATRASLGLPGDVTVMNPGTASAQFMIKCE